MNGYLAIGHFKGNENTTCVALTAHTKKDFMNDCYGNEFVPYVVLTETMMSKVLSLSEMDLFYQVKKLTTNYRVWDTVCDYIEQCSDLIIEKMETAKSFED